MNEDQVGMDLGGAAPLRLPMVGVSTVAKDTIWPGEGLLEWAHRRGRDGKPLRDQGNLNRGNATHRVSEALFAGKRVYVEQYPVDQRGFVDGMLDWHATEQPKLVACEVSLKDPELRCNGRIDYVRACPGCPICEVDGGDGNGVRLGDYKTGGLMVSRTSHVQVGGGYRHLWAVTNSLLRPHRGVCCGAEVVAIDQHGRYRVVQAQSTPDAFLRALAWYRDLETIPDPFARQPANTA